MEKKSNDFWARLAKAQESICARIKELDADIATYEAYEVRRVRDKDRHGSWDVAINLSECECEKAGLEFALKALSEVGL